MQPQQPGQAPNPENQQVPPPTPQPAGQTQAQTQTVISPQLATALGMTQQKKSHKKAILGSFAAVVALLLIIGGGYLYYQHHQQQAAADNFNKLAAQIKKQELSGLKNYISLQTTLNGTRPLLSVALESVADENQLGRISDQLKLTNSSLQRLTTGACAAKASDLDSTKIAQQMGGLPLSQNQSRYVADMEKVTDGLNNTLYSSVTTCADGAAFISVYDKMVQLLPGLNILHGLRDKIITTPTDDQVDILKTCRDIDFVNRDVLQSKLPQTYVYLANLKEACVTAFQKFDSLSSGDQVSADKYSQQLDDLLTQLGDYSNMQKELDNFNQGLEASVVKASWAEIDAINYQVEHQSTNSNMQLDTQLPAFRIAEASVINYAHQNDGKAPFGNDISDIAQLDGNMKKLNSEGLLKHLDYRALGGDRHGFILSVTLSDGTELIDRINPPSSQVI